MNNLRKLRKKKGLTLIELSRLVNIKKSSIACYETGVSTMDADTIKKFTDFYNVSADYLLGSNDNIIESTSTSNIDTLFFSLHEIIDDEQKRKFYHL